MTNRAMKLLACGLTLAMVLLPLAARGGPPGGPSLQQVVNGIEIYLGIVPAEIVGGHPREHPESEMHGGAPGSGYHVMVALFDRATGKRITNAEVTAKLVMPSSYTVGKKLELMTIAGSQAYGNYFKMIRGESYRIDFEIRRRGSPGVVYATFHWAAV